MDTPFEIKEGHRTNSYIGTVQHHTRSGKLIIEAIRKEWKRRSQLDGKDYYVKLQGRMGKNNPNKDKYSVINTPKHWYGGHSHQCIRLGDASYADMYVYER